MVCMGCDPGAAGDDSIVLLRPPTEALNSKGNFISLTELFGPW